MWKFILVAFYFYLQYALYYAYMKSIIENVIENEEVPIETHVYAIDFDNTIAYTQYPKIIKPIPHAFDVLKVLSQDPHSILILWTCREKEDLQDALNFCEKHGVKFDYVNENCERNLKLFKNDCRKVSADIYIDDHSYEGIKGVENLWKDWWSWMKENGIR